MRFNSVEIAAEKFIFANDDFAAIKVTVDDIKSLAGEDGIILQGTVVAGKGVLVHNVDINEDGTAAVAYRGVVDAKKLDSAVDTSGYAALKGIVLINAA